MPTWAGVSGRRSISIASRPLSSVSARPRAPEPASSLRNVATTSTAASARRVRYGSSRSVSSSDHCMSSRTRTTVRSRAMSRSRSTIVANARCRSWASRGLGRSRARGSTASRSAPRAERSAANGRAASSAAHSATITWAPARAAASAACRTSAVLPIPAGPDTSTSSSRPGVASASASSSVLSSALRPMSSRAITRTGPSRAKCERPDKQPRRLGPRLLLVRDPVRRGRDRPADHAGEDHDGHQVRQRGIPEGRDRSQEVPELAARGAHPDDDTERRERAEEERAAECADRRPAAEDHRGEGDEPAPARHAVLERAGRLEGEIRAGEPRERASRDHVLVSLAEDVDADGIRRLGVLADGARAQTPARAEQEELQCGDEHDRRERDRAEPEDERRDHAGPAEPRRRDDQPVEVRGEPDRADVEDRPRDDLVGAHGDAEPRVQQAEQSAGDDGDDDTRRDRGRRSEGRVQREAGEVPGERRGEHDALDTDVHHAGPLVEHAAERAEGERGREAEDDRREVGQDRDEVAGELDGETRDEEDVHQVRTDPSAHVRVTVVAPSMSSGRARTRKTRRTISSAARNRMMSAWMMSMISIGTWVVIFMSGAPARKATNSSAANRIPIGSDRPRSATAIESNPTDALIPDS